MSRLSFNHGIPQFVSLCTFERLPPETMHARAQSFYAEMQRRKTIRDFSSEAVPREAIEACLRTAGTAPSGANHQPWHFCVVQSPVLKKRIREEAENEKPYILLVVGYPKEGCMVPNIRKKPLADIASFL